MLTTSSAEWRDDVAALHALVDLVGQKDSSEKWGTHPAFGQVSGEEWVCSAGDTLTIIFASSASEGDNCQ